MQPGRASPDAERRAVAKTEAWFEKRVAPQTGTAHAKARASVGWGIGGDPGQFDCVDTTANTTSLLTLLRDTFKIPKLYAATLLPRNLPQGYLTASTNVGATSIVTSINPGACVIANGSLAAAITACGVTPHAQNTGISSASTGTGSP